MQFDETGAEVYITLKKALRKFDDPISSFNPYEHVVCVICTVTSHDGQRMSASTHYHNCLVTTRAASDICTNNRHHRVYSKSEV